ncbi:AAA family ATPase [Burkholderia cepacia]|uniref:AAA family ATPase n=1 Tax=Burkholderia cepacia TaxID=292 RepID=UPI002019219D|nr:ATP-binding protein [Burkholderia cepacia]UQO35520.1 ATP-binding protein [Burkholderia cepacia]UQO45832.1 ATP-binding protein [Burkholderia cepacia]UQP10916.1 ATP-binding protein [Burkholderia cepacia]
MILSLTVRNFKSIVDLNLKFSEHFNCLVGLNGAGKTSVLQAIDFAAHMMGGDIDSWLKVRGWASVDLHSKLSTASNIVFSIIYKLPNGKLMEWRSAFNRVTRSCTREDVSEILVNKAENSVSRKLLFDVFRNRYSVGDADKSDIPLNYEGSLLSHLKEDLLSEDLITLRDCIQNIRSLELLSPHLMRAASRETDSDIGIGGEKLSAYLFTIKGEERENLVNLLKKFYPSVVDFKVVQQRAGWKRLVLIEEYAERRVETDAKHINDGLLRVLAILSQSQSKQSVLLFDEVENGVNPEIAEKLVDILQECPQQVIVTSHSPLILNYLSDETARKAVTFVYRSWDGSSKARRFFSLPQVKDKLDFMGPGEAFVDTNLTALTAECVRLDRKEAIAKKEAEIAAAEEKSRNDSKKSNGQQTN